MFFNQVYFGSAIEGPPGFAHGGSIAAVLDEAMGFAAWIAGQTVVAAKLSVYYKKMLPLKTIATIEAWIDSVKGRKVITKSKIYDDNGKLLIKGVERYVDISAFSPGEYFKIEGRGINSFASEVKCPVFITSAKNEEKQWKAIYDSVKTDKKYFLPEDEGKHGSKALWSNNNDHQEYWKNVTEFLLQFQ